MWSFSHLSGAWDTLEDWEVMFEIQRLAQFYEFMIMIYKFTSLHIDIMQCAIPGWFVTENEHHVAINILK